MKSNRFACVLFFFIANCNNYCLPNNAGKINFEIAVILPLTKKLHTEGDFDKCSDELRPDTLQTVEAFYYSLDLVERDEELSRNFTLSIHVVENCDESVSDMLHFSRLLQELFRKNETSFKKNQNFKLDLENDTSSHLIAVIYSNEFTKLRYDSIFPMIPSLPYISFTGPSKEFLNVNEIKSGVVSVTSGHIFIIDVIFEILAYHKWKYVLFISSVEADSSKSFLTHVQELAANDGVCISQFMNTDGLHLLGMFYNFTNKEQFEQNLRIKIPSYETVNVIICYCKKDEINELQLVLQSGAERMKKFVVIAGNDDETWEEVTWNAKLGDLYYVTPAPQYDEKFYHYYTSSSLQNHTKHENLKTFRKRYFKCQDYKNGTEEKCDGDTDTYKNTYKNDSRAANIIKSVHLIAHAVKRSLNGWYFSTDEGSKEVSPRQFRRRQFRRRQFRSFLGTDLEFIKFTLFDEEVSFTKRGFPRIEKFDIYKSQTKGNETSDEVIKVAEYLKYGDTDDPRIVVMRDRLFKIEGNLTVLDDTFYGPKNYAKPSCSEPCPLGHLKQKRNDQCCWDCAPCAALEVLTIDATSCIKCPDGFMPDENKKACITVPIQIPSKWYNGQNLISMCFSLLSIILAAITSVVFVKYRDTPVVKSTTKELCYVMFAGIILANSAVFVSVSSRKFKASVGKVLPAIGFTMIYAALLMKTNRISRILPKSENAFPNINPKLVSITAQIIFTIVLIGIETLICWHSVQVNETKLNNEKNGADSFMIMHYLNGIFLMKIFVFVYALVSLCVYFAIKMRHLPGNYNETKYIAFAMYATIPTSLLFGLVYLISEYKILAVNLGISINSLTVLVFLFLPKLNIILRRPEQNTKAYCATITPNIRKHVRNELRQHE